MSLQSLANIKYVVNTTSWLSLDGSENDLAAGYTYDRKYNLKSGLQWSWELGKSNDLKPIIELFANNHASGIEGGVGIGSYKVLEAIFTETQRRKCSELWYAKQGDQIHAGILLLKEANFAIYIFNAANDTGRIGNARTVLLDHYFTQNAERPTIFDFESPQVDSIKSFYRSFGGDEIPFITIEKTSLPSPLQQLLFLRRLLIKAKRDLYGALCKILDPFRATRS